jgi:hypothetical protein
MKPNVRFLTLIALAAALGMTGALAQQNPPKPAKLSRDAQSAMTDQCKDMMAMHNQMAADMKAMDAKLDLKVAAMDAAGGNSKVDAMATVINEMVSQRKEMMANMMSMQNKMMAHMGEHMGQSGGQAMRQSMALCPMMKGMTR